MISMLKGYSSINIFFLITYLFISCKDSAPKENMSKPEQKHHLNIPANGIQSLMEENTQKIIEGTDGSVIIMIGEITRKKADITIKYGDKILDERIVSEDETMNFNYEGNKYSLVLHNIKKPLLGAGKAEISIQ